MKSRINTVFTLFLWPAILISCSGGSSKESAVAKKIALSTSAVALVLPNTLTTIFGQTCSADDIVGPRVRMKAALTWQGEGNLLPIVIRLVITNDTRLSGDYAGSVSPGISDKESLAGIFGLDTDYIPPGTTLYSTTNCFLDFGGMPKPVQELKGAAQLIVPATLSMFGLVRKTDGSETPFVKEIPATVTFVAGSVPPQ